jgi:hypothetical protein
MASRREVFIACDIEIRAERMDELGRGCANRRTVI